MQIASLECGYKEKYKSVKFFVYSYFQCCALELERMNIPVHQFYDLIYFTVRIFVIKICFLVLWSNVSCTFILSQYFTVNTNYDLNGG